MTKSQYARNLPDIFKYIFFDENVEISTKFPVKQLSTSTVFNTFCNQYWQTPLAMTLFLCIYIDIYIDIYIYR